MHEGSARGLRGTARPTLQDTEQLISRHDLDDYIIASLSLYLDILNLFMKARRRPGAACAVLLRHGCKSDHDVVST
jgi:hypothetical protein